MLAFINKELDRLSIPYEFGKWSADTISYPYWVGEYIEEPSYTEDGKESCAFILTGFNRGDFLILEQQKEAIKNHFWNGITKAENGIGYAAFYGNAIVVPEDDPDLQKLQIELTLMKWKER